MFKKLLYTIVFTSILFVIIGLFLPRDVHVERSVEINRPASTVFALLNSYSTFSSWSPWAARDPDAIYKFSGPESGVGTRMSWSGDPRLVGTGWQEITESRPHSLIRTRLYFDQQGAAQAYFQLDPSAAGVRVTWGFDTDLLEGQGFFGGFLARYFGLFFDTWIGTDYEQGLANLKIFAESLPAADFSILDVELIDVAAFDILYISSGAGQNPDEIADFLAAAYREISSFMVENEVEISGQPLAITRAASEQDFQIDAAIPVLMKPLEPGGRVRAGQSPSGWSVRLVHTGPYREIMASYEKLAAYMAAHGLREGPVSWEHYISDPGETPEAELITHIYFQTRD